MEETTIQARSETDQPPPGDEAEIIRRVAEVASEWKSFLAEVAAFDTEILYDEQGPIPAYPPRRYDEAGRQLPLTPEEARLSDEIFRRTMAVIDANDQDPPGSNEEFMRGIDSRRPEGMKLFEGYY